MKVILLQELKGRGGEGDIIEVARGFAVNYLLPRKVAIEATSGNVKQLEQRMHNIKTREDQLLNSAGSLAVALEGKSVTVFAKVGEEGRLFGSVTAHMVERLFARSSASKWTVDASRPTAISRRSDRTRSTSPSTVM
jgi:large subunit ribosomal protein L9